MGYTVSIKMPKEKSELTKKMLSFIETLADSADSIPYLQEAKDLSYCDKKGHIGFNYGPGQITREWCYVLIHWISRKIGDGKHFYYDGYREKLSKERNDLGIRQFDDIEVEFGFFPGIDFQKEMEKIDAAWNALDLQKTDGINTIVDN
jgi:hypothetical protein